MRPRRDPWKRWKAFWEVGTGNWVAVSQVSAWLQRCHILSCQAAVLWSRPALTPLWRLHQTLKLPLLPAYHKQCSKHVEQRDGNQIPSRLQANQNSSQFVNWMQFWRPDDQSSPGSDTETFLQCSHMENRSNLTGASLLWIHYKQGQLLQYCVASSRGVTPYHFISTLKGLHPSFSSGGKATSSSSPWHIHLIQN